MKDTTHTCRWCGTVYVIPYKRGQMNKRQTCSDECLTALKKAKRGHSGQVYTSGSQLKRYNRLCEAARKISRSDKTLRARRLLREHFQCTGLYNKEVGEVVRW